MQKEMILNVLKKPLKKLKIKLNNDEILNSIEIPPSYEMGDYAFPCFSIASQLKQSPHELALNIRQEIGNPRVTDFDDIQVNGPYVNFFLDRKNMARKVVWEAINQKKNFGKNKSGKGKKTMVEFPSPNTNKPLHLGHMRNMALGESISRILEFNGEKVLRANLYNDRGIHICKSMLAYQKWGKEKTPLDKKIKPDHFVGNFYVMFNKKKTKKLEAEAQELLRKWEEGDKRTLLLWKLMNVWAIRGFEETYKTFGVRHDVNFLESKLYKKGKKIVLEGVKKGLFEQTKSGEVKINLKKEGLGEKILLRKDGTSIYVVQDMALAEEKFKKYDIDRSLYVVGSEQEYHFRVLFSILKKLGFEKKDMIHVSYGLVNLPHGRMKSREGTIVDADDLIEDLRSMAEKKLSKDKKLSKNEMYERSLAVALSAIKYFLLKVDIKKTMLFNPKKSLSFEGNTGPYMQYSYARASSILKKAGPSGKFEILELEPKEIEFVKKLSDFQDVVLDAYRLLNPAIIANYAYNLCQTFNEFYHVCPVIGSKTEAFRLALVQTFRQILNNALYLLGISVIEEM